MASGFVKSQSPMPMHPLAALQTSEYWTVYEVLQESGRMDADTAYASPLLHESAKDKVLAWSYGEPFSREADAYLFRQGHVIETRVDVNGRKLESWKEIRDAQAPMMERVPGTRRRR
jgi:primary-amine oxidase